MVKNDTVGARINAAHSSRELLQYEQIFGTTCYIAGTKASQPIKGAGRSW